MGLFANLTSSVRALNAFEQSLEVAQNNVSNASTAGYAKQLATLNALPFQPQTGLLGGVQAGAPQSTRDEYLEQAVQYQNSSAGELHGASAGSGRSRADLRRHRSDRHRRRAEQHVPEFFGLERQSRFRRGAAGRIVQGAGLGRELPAGRVGPFERHR